MQTYEITVRERAITRTSNDPTMVRTSRGVDRLHILFDSPEWLDFDLSVAMYNGGVLVESPVTVTPLLGDHLAECYVNVPDEVLESLGALGVTVHGTDESDNHIITERAFPFTVEQEGDEEGGPTKPPITLVQSYLPDGAEIEWFDSRHAMTVSWDFDVTCQGVIIDTQGQQVKVSGNSGTRWQIGTCNANATLPTVISTGANRISYSHNVALSNWVVTPGANRVFVGIVNNVGAGNPVTLEIELV